MKFPLLRAFLLDHNFVNRGSSFDVPSSAAAANRLPVLFLAMIGGRLDASAGADVAAVTVCRFNRSCQ